MRADLQQTREATERREKEMREATDRYDEETRAKLEAMERFDEEMKAKMDAMQTDMKEMMKEMKAKFEASDKERRGTMESMQLEQRLAMSMKIPQTTTEEGVIAGASSFPCASAAHRSNTLHSRSDIIPYAREGPSYAWLSSARDQQNHHRPRSLPLAQFAESSSLLSYAGPR